MAAFLRFSNEDYYQSADSMIVPIEVQFTDSVRSFEKKFLTRNYPYFRTVFKPRRGEPRLAHDIVFNQIKADY